MPVIRYDTHSLSVKEGESVLETLLSADCEIPNNCQVGVCQSCLMQVVDGQVNDSAQHGLKDSWQAQGMFLACQCRPDQDLEIRLPVANTLRVVCKVTEHKKLTGDVATIRLHPLEAFDYHPGQHLVLWRNAMLGRTYSLASVPDIDGEELEIHVKHLTGGALSPWLHDDLQVGDQLEIQGPGGDCFYIRGSTEQNLLLAGTGTGLAPLYGIARDALQQGHSGEIHLYHGSLFVEGLYLHDILKQLTKTHSNFHYHPCTLNGTPEQDHAIEVGSLDELLGREQADLRDWKVYLCGADNFVKKQQRQCFLAGAKIQDIYKDAFLG